jgi:large subunit ribosomal protein L16
MFFYKKKFVNITTGLLQNKKNLILKNLYGIRTVKCCIVSEQLLEALRKYLIRKTKKNCIIFLKIKPIQYTTKKSIGARMGKGFGSFDKKIFFLKSGTTFLEIFTMRIKLLKYFVKKLQSKFPVKFKFVKRIFFYKYKFML